MGVATTKVLVVVTSQLLVVGFLFQNMGKTIFESIIFVFVMHPFDVGDRCVIDGVQVSPHWDIMLFECSTTNKNILLPKLVCLYELQNTDLWLVWFWC